jgi:hypothetical protein
LAATRQNRAVLSHRGSAEHASIRDRVASLPKAGPHAGSEPSPPPRCAAPGADERSSTDPLDAWPACKAVLCQLAVFSPSVGSFRVGVQPARLGLAVPGRAGRGRGCCGCSGCRGGQGRARGSGFPGRRGVQPRHRPAARTRTGCGRGCCGWSGCRGGPARARGSRFPWTAPGGACRSEAPSAILSPTIRFSTGRHGRSA